MKQDEPLTYDDLANLADPPLLTDEDPPVMDIGLRDTVGCVLAGAAIGLLIAWLLA